jgi:D-amino peptidase
VRVFISADMEGVAGVNRGAETAPFAPGWETSRRLMTGEVNAAIEGALDAGVQEVVVNDGHWLGNNLLLEDLHPAAEVVSGQGRPLSMAEGMGPNFDAAFFVGYHASAGTPDAVLDHTYADPAHVMEVRLDGAVQSEGSLNGYVCGAFGCPVALFTGDSSAVSQMHEFCLEVEGIVVKEPLARESARSLHPSVACARIREGARRALERLDNIPPLVPASNPVFEVDFQSKALAAACARVPGVELLGSRTVRFSGADYLDGFRLFLALVDLAGTAAG